MTTFQIMAQIKMLTGVVEVGLFCKMAQAAYFGNAVGPLAQSCLSVLWTYDIHRMVLLPFGGRTARLKKLLQKAQLPKNKPPDTSFSLVARLHFADAGAFSSILHSFL